MESDSWIPNFVGPQTSTDTTTLPLYFYLTRITSSTFSLRNPNLQLQNPTIVSSNTTMCPSGRQSASSSDFRPAFDILDADRDGKISRDDLRTFYSQIYGGIAGGDDVIGAMITVADTNKDGFVEYEEFERVVTGNGERRALGCWAMEDVFRVMDKDGDGKLSHQDLKTYMAWAGFSATDDDINAMIKLGGGDSNGGVTFDGLLRILALES